MSSASGINASTKVDRMSTRSLAGTSVSDVSSLISVSVLVSSTSLFISSSAILGSSFPNAGSLHTSHAPSSTRASPVKLTLVTMPSGMISTTVSADTSFIPPASLGICTRDAHEREASV